MASTPLSPMGGVFVLCSLICCVSFCVLSEAEAFLWFSHLPHLCCVWVFFLPIIRASFLQEGPIARSNLFVLSLQLFLCFSPLVLLVSSSLGDMNMAHLGLLISTSAGDGPDVWLAGQCDGYMKGTVANHTLILICCACYAMSRRLGRCAFGHPTEQPRQHPTQYERGARRTLRAPGQVVLSLHHSAGNARPRFAKRSPLRVPPRQS